MKWLTLHLELVTPCFLAGAAGAGTTEESLREEGLRPASLIGQWRYWFRAAFGGRGGNWQEREGLLFGTQHGGGRQGALWVRPGTVGTYQTIGAGRPFEPSQAMWFREGSQPINPLNYLLGQGLYNFTEGLTRPALAQGQTLPVDITIRPAASAGLASLWEGLRGALWLWQTFGGLGSRCRRGWGSIAVSRVENLGAIADDRERGQWQTWFPDAGPPHWNQPARSAWLDRLLHLAGVEGEGRRADQTAAFTRHDTDPTHSAAASSGAEPPFSHLGWSYAYLSPAAYDKWEDALAIVGRAMLRARSNAPGRPRPPGLCRVSDHDEVYQLVHSRTPMPVAPQRVAFGLPHNYFFRGTKKGTEYHGSEPTGRRASPVMIHIARVAGERGKPAFVPVVLWLKSRLTEQPIRRIQIDPVQLPNGRTRKQRTDDRKTYTAPDWSAVVEFLTELETPGTFACTTSAAPPGGGGRPLPPPDRPPPPAVKPWNTGWREGILKKRPDGKWVAQFPEVGREAPVVLDPNKLLPKATDGCKAYFQIKDASKNSPRADLVKLL